jgi:prepilin-type N-terminal cleavage/methylation domain-containing protein
MKSTRRAFQRAREYRNDGGFTLVEMLITIAIVGMITASVVAAFSLSVKTTTNASNRIKESNTAQFITRFLVPDAASAGGFDEQNRSVLENGARPGVYIQSGSTGGFCDVTGSIVRFEWITREGAGSTRVASNYSLNGGELVRTFCSGSTTPTTVVLGRNISTATPSCTPACTPSPPGQNPVSPPPVIVSLNVTTSSSTSLPQYSFSASGFVRAGGSAGTPTTATVPLIALGVTGTPCPTMRGGTGNNATGQVQASGVAVAAPKTSSSSGNPADPFEPKITVFGVAAINSNATTSAACGQAGNIS